MSSIESEHFVKALRLMLDEAFDCVHGFFLDPHTSLFETLATISAAEASVPVGGQCATLAAQVKHVAFYLDVLNGYMHNPNQPGADWGEIWRTVSRVTPDEWEAVKAELRDSYNRILGVIGETAEWPNEALIGEAMGAVVHTAYHLGEIRQALCTLKSKAD